MLTGFENISVDKGKSRQINKQLGHSDNTVVTTSSEITNYLTV